MNILFVGTNVPDEIEYQVKNISAAGNRFQNNLVENLKRDGHHVETVAYLAVPFDEKHESLLSEEVNYHYVKKEPGFCGLWRSIVNYKNRVHKLLEKADCVICYNIIYAWLWLPRLAKMAHKKSVLILADYGDTDSFLSYKQKLYARMQKNCIRRFDLVVGLSERVKDLLLPEQSFLLMEGGIDDSLYDSLQHHPETSAKQLKIVYSGLLNHVTGVNLFLEAMDRVVASSPYSISTIVSGKGELAKEIENKANQCKWLTFLGHVPYENYIELIRDADILVNPRDMRLPENKNNFPSKVLDYLATGNYVISTSFIGGEKYADYITFAEVVNLETALRSEIKKVMQDTEQERAHRYELNREFAKKFLWHNQVKRIIKGIQELD